ncbi:hypothetical protein CPJ18_26275 [Agrobacterium rosae]|uniref:Gas vesicle protein n=1 Tax=Agrobacterium rosae TaxID=1972867 RepID=A0AAE5RSR2_9HYPH|nr:gas vesicle accessory protein GvpU [Agrobacterium rosae]POO48432.1 hypothetical protein CPJ18_26275 [Agrobacterium rosae]
MNEPVWDFRTALALTSWPSVTDGHAEAYGLEINVTITVGGTMISGTVVSGHKYMQEISKAFRNANTDSPEIIETLAESFEAWAPVYHEPLKGPSIFALKPNYIHLRRARAFDGSGNPVPQNGMLWRGKIAAVDGFSMGEFKCN